MKFSIKRARGLPNAQGMRPSGMQQPCMVETESIRPAGVSFITAFVRRLSKAEAAAAVVVFLALIVTLFAFKMVRVDQFRGDSAMYFQATENVAHGRALASQVQASIVDYLNVSRFQDLTPDDIRQDPGSFFGHASSGERSLLAGHAYFILYPVAQLARVFPVTAVLLFLLVASFAGMLLLAYSVLRREHVPIVGALLFCLLVIAHPAWTNGLLWGQFYPDRLFLLLGLLVMVLTANAVPESPRGKLLSRCGLFAAALLCASINERAAIVPGIFMIMYALLYWKKPGLDRHFKLGLGAALLCYGLLIVKVLLPSQGDYGSFLPTSWHALVIATHRPQFLPMVELFLLVNLPLLCLAIFEWRVAVIASVLMLPNIFGSIGGAEKVGWSTHYPSFYFTPLVWAALTGLVALYRMTVSKKTVGAVYAGIGAFIVFLALLNPLSYQPINVAAENVKYTFWAALHDQAATWFFDAAPRDAMAADVTGLQNAIPPGSIVSSVEGGMPHLYHGRTIEYFPMDIDNADYAVLGARNVEGKISYGGTINFRPAPERQEVDNLVLARMKRDGYDLAHPKLFPQLGGLAVVRRMH